MNPTALNRRAFLRHAATFAFATAAATPGSVLAAKPAPNRYPYLGRTGDYTDFQLIEPGRTITKIESWTQGNYGFVRLTTNDGHQGWGQLSSYEPDIQHRREPQRQRSPLRPRAPGERWPGEDPRRPGLGLHP